MKQMILNPDEKYVNSIRTSIKNLGGHCPCVPSYTRSQDTICPCKEYRDNQICNCDLYVEVSRQLKHVKILDL